MDEYIETQLRLITKINQNEGLKQQLIETKLNHSTIKYILQHNPTIKQELFPNKNNVDDISYYDIIIVLINEYLEELRQLKSIHATNVNPNKHKSTLKLMIMGEPIFPTGTINNFKPQMNSNLHHKLMGRNLPVVKTNTIGSTTTTTTGKLGQTTRLSKGNLNAMAKIANQSMSASEKKALRNTVLIHQPTYNSSTSSNSSTFSTSYQPQNLPGLSIGE
jgi:hypothetical protein